MKRSRDRQSLILLPLLENKINQKLCKNFAKFLQQHILQDFLHFRPREEAVRRLYFPEFTIRNSCFLKIFWCAIYCCNNQ